MNTDMKGCSRCKCTRLPEAKIESKETGYTVELFCAQDGWRAVGDSFEQAKEHWNIFVTFMMKEAA